MNLAPDKHFYSMRDIATLFGVSLSLVKQELRWKMGEPVKVGRRCIRWSREQVEDFIETRMKNERR